MTTILIVKCSTVFSEVQDTIYSESSPTIHDKNNFVWTVNMAFNDGDSTIWDTYNIYGDDTVYTSRKTKVSSKRCDYYYHYKKEKLEYVIYTDFSEFYKQDSVSSPFDAYARIGHCYDKKGRLISYIYIDLLRNTGEFTIYNKKGKIVYSEKRTNGVIQDTVQKKWALKLMQRKYAFFCKRWFKIVDEL